VRGTKLTEQGSRSKHLATRLNLGDTKVAISFFISMREVNGVTDHLFVKADEESFGPLVPILQMLTQYDICGRHYHSVFDQTPTGTGVYLHRADTESEDRGCLQAVVQEKQSPKRLAPSASTKACDE